MLRRTPTRIPPMASTADNLESAALQLPRSERARLAERLIASLDEDSELERAWSEEIERRVADFRAGKVKPIPGKQVFDELKDLFQ